MENGTFVYTGFGFKDFHCDYSFDGKDLTIEPHCMPWEALSDETKSDIETAARKHYDDKFEKLTGDLKMNFDKYMDGKYDKLMGVILALLIAFVVLAPTAIGSITEQQTAEDLAAHDKTWLETLGE